jgi:branched-chain amino acid transport system substrate-binding protein
MINDHARSSHRRRTRIGALLVVVGLVAASCGGDDDDEPAADEPTAEEPATADEPTAEEPATAEEPTADEPTAAEPTAEEPTAEEPATSEEPTAEETSGEASTAEEPAAEVEGKVTDFAGYIGGEGPADDSLAPVKVGVVNQQGGAVFVSDTNDDGVNIAVEFINTHAGGINGHPLEIVECTIANAEEEGQQCGQEMANDDEIVAVIIGPTFIGTEAFYAALGGEKPVVAGVSVNPTDLVQPNAAVLNGGAAYILAPFATFARDTLGVESAALIYPEGAGQDDAAAGQSSAFEAAGIPIEVVSYPPTAPDLTQPLLAAGAADVDLVMPVINTADCVKFAEAQRQLGIPDENVLASPVCLTPATIEGLGAFPNWIYAVASSLSTDPTDPSVPPYTDILAEQGQEAFIGDPWVLVGFAQAMTMAKWLNAVGADNLSSDAILAEMQAFTGPLILGSPVLECGKYPEAPAACNDYTQFYKNDDMVFTLAGDFVGPPEGWTVPG